MSFSSLVSHFVSPCHLSVKLTHPRSHNSILQNVLHIHAEDPNFPLEIIDKIKLFLGDDNIIKNPEAHADLIHEVGDRDSNPIRVIPNTRGLTRRQMAIDDR